MLNQFSKMTASLTIFSLTAVALVAPGCDKDDADADADAVAEARAHGKAVAQEFAALHAEVERDRSRIDACFAAALGNQAGVAGTIPLNFHLAADGAVLDVGIDEHTIGAEVGACVKDVAASWRLTRLTDGPTTIPISVDYGRADPAAALADNGEVNPAPGEDAASASKMAVDGALDPDLIRRIVVAHINEVRYCYNQALAKDPELAGAITAQFTISGSGKITEKVAIDGTTGDAEMDACIAAAVGRWMFPKPEGGGEVKVSYPFAFSPG